MLHGYSLRCILAENILIVIEVTESLLLLNDLMVESEEVDNL